MPSDFSVMQTRVVTLSTVILVQIIVAIMVVGLGIGYSFFLYLAAFFLPTSYLLGILLVSEIALVSRGNLDYLLVIPVLVGLLICKFVGRRFPFWGLMLGYGTATVIGIQTLTLLGYNILSIIPTSFQIIMLPAIIFVMFYKTVRFQVNAIRRIRKVIPELA